MKRSRQAGTFAGAIDYLRRVDPMLESVALRVRLQPVKHSRNHFRSLVASIISQQLSTKAAGTIHARFIALFPGTTFPKPGLVAAAPDDRLRSSGLSAQKVLYIKGVAAAVASGALDFGKIRKLSDEDAILSLTHFSGIGRWTAEMFLIFSLARDDVFSPGDLGLKNAMTKLYAKRGTLSFEAMQKISSRWAPYRSHACRLLWASLDMKY